jgi:hypothetical protein
MSPRRAKADNDRGREDGTPAESVLTADEAKGKQSGHSVGSAGSNPAPVTPSVSLVTETLDRIETIVRTEIERIERAAGGDFALGLGDAKKIELLVKSLLQLEARQKKRDDEFLDGKSEDELRKIAESKT